MIAVENIFRINRTMLKKFSAKLSKKNLPDRTENIFPVPVEKKFGRTLH
jgi:hypothetical protein